MIGGISDGRLQLAHDRSIPVTVKYSDRARRMRMTLSAEGALTVTLPRRTSRTEMEEFIRTSLPWIERTLFKLSLRTRRKTVKPPSFPQEFTFPVTGEHFPVRYEWHNVCWLGVREENGTIQVTGKVLDPVPVHEALTGYLIRKAGLVFEPLLRQLAAEHGFRLGKMSFRFQRGRWGSCSRARDISLNAQMLFLQPEEVHYVMIHELCHTREMNHSARFWQEVAKYCPDYLRIRKALKQNRPEIWH
ncbi:MAG: M48 family metallopeptidase [Lentisphaeria bacterium]|nr:M48 family metallopeptidase [Lentisphaeria bacterium]